MNYLDLVTIHSCSRISKGTCVDKVRNLFCVCHLNKEHIYFDSPFQETQGIHQIESSKADFSNVTLYLFIINNMKCFNSDALVETNILDFYARWKLRLICY